MSFFQTKSAKIAMAVISAAAIIICALLIIFFKQQTNDEQTAISSEATRSYAATGDKTAYLTFDGGPSNCTAAVLSILKEANIKASFFTAYQNSSTLQEYYTDITEQGHLLGVMGYAADDSVYTSAADYMANLQQMMTFLEITIRQTTSYIRLPGGSNNAAVEPDIMQQVLLNLDQNGYTYYDWNVWADGEGERAAKEEIVSQIVSSALQMTDPVIRLHDSNDNDAMVEALPEIIEQLKQAGYSFDTVDHMVTPLHHVEYIEPDVTSEAINSYDPIETSSATPSYSASSSSSRSATSSAASSNVQSSSAVASASDDSSEDSSDGSEESGTGSDSSEDTSYQPESDPDE